MALTGYMCFDRELIVMKSRASAWGGMLARLLFAWRTPNTLILRYNPRSPLRSEARLRGLNCPTRAS
jgi:hypothetical protein